jgi:threonine dehydrogenase-like Zn-dependent dehydrogenase
LSGIKEGVAALPQKSRADYREEPVGVELDPLMQSPDPMLGRFARVALVACRMRVDYHFLWASIQRLSFHQSTHFDQPTLERVTELAATGPIDLGALVKEEVPIDDAVGIYDTLRDDPLSLGGTVFDWRAS